jgi:hypothetical protein
MKKLLIFALLLLFTKSLFAQTISKDTIGLNIPYNNGVVVYEKVVNAGYISKAMLASNAQTWFLQCYNNHLAVMPLDTSDYRIVGNGSEVINFKGALWATNSANANFLLQIDCKDGRYRYRIFDINVVYYINNQKCNFPANDMAFVLTGGKNDTGFTINQLKSAAAAINNMVNIVVSSLNQNITQNTNADF